MQITVKQLRCLLEQAVEEAKIAASPEYLRKERVREAIQHAVASMVAAGEVKDDDDLKQLFVGADAAVKALKAIPLDVWKKLAAKR